MSELHLAALHRLCKKFGADRVSPAAAEQLGVEIERVAEMMVKEALNYTMMSGRTTLFPQDVETASRKILGRLRRQSKQEES